MSKPATPPEKKVKCMCCTTVFDTDETQTRRVYHSYEENLFEDFNACPNCGSLDLEWVTKCKGCDTWLTDYESETEGFCDNCTTELHERFSIMLEQFDEDEQAALETMGLIGAPE